MPWNTPITFNAATPLSASILNAQVRDNLLFLFSGKAFAEKAMVDGGAVWTTASATLVDINAGYTLTANLTTGRALVLLMGAFYSDGGVGRLLQLVVDIDGTDYALLYHTLPGTAAMLSGFRAVTLSPGSHVFKPQWAVGSGGPANLLHSATAPTALIVMEV